MTVHSKSSQKWLQEHHRDQYVKRAQTDGYRSRASYKLIEINTKTKNVIQFFIPNYWFIDY